VFDDLHGDIQVVEQIGQNQHQDRGTGQKQSGDGDAGRDGANGFRIEPAEQADTEAKANKAENYYTGS
jgi:hypothetical protein